MSSIRHLSASDHVLVLGAGIVGVSTALALQQRGHRVSLVDRREPGQETSYGNAGIIQREAVRPYAFPRNWRKLVQVALGKANDVHYHLRAMPALAPLLWRYRRRSAPAAYAPIASAYAALIAHSLTEHETWILASGAESLVRKRGWMQGYRDPAQFDAAVRDATAIAAQHGLAVAALDAPALAVQEPDLRAGLAGAVHWRDPWTVADPGDLVAHYAQLFVARGGEIHRGDASTLSRNGVDWQVTGDKGVLKAGHVVLALGPWSDDVLRRLGYRFPLFVKRGYHRHYVGGGMLTRPLLDVSAGVMIAPMRQGLRLTTGAEFARRDGQPTPLQAARAEVSTRELIDLGTPVEPQPWLGARPCTADMIPVIGAAPRHPGLWFNFGHAHQGFTLGPASARLLAELMAGATPYIDAKPYAAERFI